MYTLKLSPIVPELFKENPLLFLPLTDQLQLCFISTPHLFLTLFLFLILFLSSIYPFSFHFNFRPQISDYSKYSWSNEKVKLDTKRGLLTLATNIITFSLEELETTPFQHSVAPVSRLNSPNYVTGYPY